MIDKDSASIVREFYSAFQSKDSQMMANLYHDEASFYDPAFGKLNATEVRAMWTMLCSSSKDLVIEFEILSSNEGEVKTKWQAYYSFGKKKRKVHNVIVSTIEVKGAKIYRHIDEFNLHKWAKQAMGVSGYLLGGTSFFKKSLNKKTKSRLLRFMS